MELKDKAELFYNYANELFPNAKCELNYYDAYSLLVAVILSAQTTDKRVNIVTKNLFIKYPDVFSLASANIKDIEEEIKSLGLYKNKALSLSLMSKELVNNYQGIIPNDRDELMKLRGVGRKTANVVMSEYFKGNYIAVDTHVSRVAIRLGFSNTDSSLYEIEENLMGLWDQSMYHKIHHIMIFFGRYHCTSQKPNCEICKIKEVCDYYKTIS